MCQLSVANLSLVCNFSSFFIDSDTISHSYDAIKCIFVPQTVLNREDPEWFWIVRSDGQEGFIPSGFVYPADNILQNSTKPSAQNAYNAAMNQLNDARQLQNQTSEQIANNEANTCQTHNMQMGTAIGHVGNTNPMTDQTSMINNGANNNSSNTNNQVQVSQQQQQSIVGASEDLRYHGTELVMLYDYKVCSIERFRHFHDSK